MAKDPPPFAQSDYWDERFTKNPAAFDWLLPANCLDGAIVEALQKASSQSNPHPRLLHIGCGTSVLSLHLRAHVDDPRQIHNTDFSRVAVDIGARWERETFEGDATGQPPLQSNEPAEGPGGREGGDERAPPRMRWSTLDLLSLASIRALAANDGGGGGRYDIVVDKSTCDAISCGNDVSVPLPHPLQAQAQPSPRSSASPSSDSSREEQQQPAAAATVGTEAATATANIHPLHILALHLAALVPPGGRWIALSYSGQRFPFFEPFPARAEEGKLDNELLDRGFVHPGRLWQLERKEVVEVDEEGEGSGGGGQVVHRPKTAHWVYVIVRTEVEVGVVGE